MMSKIYLSGTLTITKITDDSYSVTVNNGVTDSMDESFTLNYTGGLLLVSLQ